MTDAVVKAQGGPTFQVTFDCADPATLSRFWAEVLGYQVQPPPDGWASWEDWLRAHDVPEERWGDAGAIVDPTGARPRIFFQRVPEPKAVKNRVHLDVNAGGPQGTPEAERRGAVATAVERAVALGARVIHEIDHHGEHWVTLADPEGNEFCLQ